MAIDVMCFQETKLSDISSAVLRSLAICQHTSWVVLRSLAICQHSSWAISNVYGNHSARERQSL